MCSEYFYYSYLLHAVLSSCFYVPNTLSALRVPLHAHPITTPLCPRLLSSLWPARSPTAACSASCESQAGRSGAATHPHHPTMPSCRSCSRLGFCFLCLILIATHYCMYWWCMTQSHGGIRDVKCSKQPQNSPFSKLVSKYLQIREELKEIRNSLWMNHKH